MHLFQGELPLICKTLHALGILEYDNSHGHSGYVDQPLGSLVMPAVLPMTLEGPECKVRVNHQTGLQEFGFGAKVSLLTGLDKNYCGLCGKTL